MSLLSQFFLGSSPAIRQFDCLEITHPNFSQTYRLVRNARFKLPLNKFGVEVTHEGPAGPFEYEYTPMKIKPVGSGSDMSQSLAVVLGDVGQIIAKEVGIVTEANGMNTRPVLKFRTYRSDDLTQPMFGPLVLELSRVTRTEEGASFEAHAPLINHSRTGVLYTITQFPMLRGFF